jgi:hypothetical protein
LYCFLFFITKIKVKVETWADKYISSRDILKESYQFHYNSGEEYLYK